MLTRFAIVLLLVTPAVAADNPAEGIKKVELTVEPADAKPGQTVTLKLKVTLAAECTVYPFLQPDKNAEFFVSKAKFPSVVADGLIYVGDLTTDAVADSKPEPVLGIKELRSHAGTITFEKKAVVSPKAAAGSLAVKFASLKLNVCKGTVCYNATDLKPEAKLTVLAGPAVEVEKDHVEAVKKALDGK